MPGARERDPEPVERAARAEHRGTSSGPANSIVTATPSGIRLIDSVDGPVHQPERDAERDGEAEVRRPMGAHARAPDRPQDDRREREPQEGGAAGPELVEERDRERRSDLE